MTCGGGEAQLRSSSIWALKRSEWLESNFDRLTPTPGKQGFVTHWMWPIDGMNVLKRENFSPVDIQITGLPDQPSQYSY